MGALCAVMGLAFLALLTSGASLSDRLYRYSTQPNRPHDPSSFTKCRPQPSPTALDLIRYRLCLDRDDAGTSAGRWERSTMEEDLQRDRSPHIEEYPQALIGDHHRLARSLHALCAGDLGQYNHEIREYIQWRCKNGYGTLMRRWGRSASFNMADPEEGKQNNFMRKYRSSEVAWDKRPEEIVRRNDMQAVVDAYREWRNSNGYGKMSGRWGRSVPMN